MKSFIAGEDQVRETDDLASVVDVPRQVSSAHAAPVSQRAEISNRTVLP